MVDVVAALIRRGNRFFICQRPADKSQGLLWEFPGGKVEPGESLEQALIRECREELKIRITVGEIFMRVEHRYPDMTVRLTLFWAETEEEPQNLEHADLRWITPAEIPNYRFCPADLAILRKIEREFPRTQDN